MGLLKDSEEQIIEAAKNGTTGRELAKLFGVCPSTISNIFRKHGFKPPTGRRQTLSLKHDAFDVITPESAYWMGFLCADGCVVDNGSGSPQIILQLGRKDRGHIEKFRTFLGSEHTIYDGVNKTSRSYGNGRGDGQVSRFNVRSRPIFEALQRRGLAVHSPLRVPSDDLADSVDFWRGEVDGDGTVRWTTDRHGSTYANIMLCGHMPLLEKFQVFLIRRGIVANIIDTTSGIYQIRLLGSGAVRLIELLYGNATVALDRKFAVARDVIETKGQFRLSTL